MHGLLAAAALAWTFLGCGQVSASAASLQVAQQLGSTSLPGPPANCSDATRRSVRWGVATAAYQVEGGWNLDGRSPSIWDTYAHTPGAIKNNDTGDVACDMYHKYPEDFKLMSSLGIKHYRFSISWSRVLPQGVAGSPVNAKGVAFYNSMINEMLKHGITPHATLFHWDLPQVLQDRYRGFLGDQFGDDFEFYARTVFESFGDRVASWMTFNEPVVICEISYGKGTFPPGPFGKEGQYRCGHNLLLAHARVYRLYESRFRAQQRGRIGIALSVHWGEPLTASAADAAASVFYIDQHLGWFLAPLTFGDYPPQLRRCVAMLPPFSAQQAASLKGSLDFVGINFYTARYIRGSAADSCVVEQLTKDAQGRQIGPRAESDWLYVAPWAFYKLLKFVHERYGGPIVYITENGVSVPGEDGKPLAQALADTFRLEYFRDHLDSLCRAVADGVRVKHYFAWSILDNFEWREGFSTRFGLVNVDFKSPARTRTVKNSGKWLAAHFFRLNGGSGGAAEAAHRKKGT